MSNDEKGPKRLVVFRVEKGGNDILTGLCGDLFHKTMNYKDPVID